MADWLPVISQLKSGFQLICGDIEGAKRTQINFSKQCPGVSQLRSVVEFASGDSEAARQTQWEFLGTVSGVANVIPVVGHVKGVVHYATGDKDGGYNAMKASSRALGVVAVGAAGFFVAGPPGAVVGGMVGCDLRFVVGFLPGAVTGGIGGGVIMDAVTTKVDTRVHGHKSPAGYMKQIGDLKKDPTHPGKWHNQETKNTYHEHNKNYTKHNMSYNDHNNHDDADTVVVAAADDYYDDDDDDDDVNVTDSRKLSRKSDKYKKQD